MSTNGKAITGNYCGLKVYPSRNVVQIIIEVEMEQAAAVTRALGWPLPGLQPPVAVVLLQEPTHDADPARVS